MPIIKCSNPKCLSFHKQIQVQKMKMKLSGGDIVLDPPVKCEWCNEDMMIVKEQFTGVPGYNRFGSLSDAGKKEMLKKRSDEHFKKEGKEQKRANFKRIISNR